MADASPPGSNRQPAFKQSNRSWSLVLLIILLISLANFLLYGFAPSDDIDEAAWIYSGYYYQLLFDNLNFSSVDWQHYDAIEHPPVYKFIVGASSTALGYRVTSIEHKNRWIRQASRNDNGLALSEYRELIPLRVFVGSRLLNTVLTALSAGILVWFASRMSSIWSGFLAAIGFLATPAVSLLAVTIYADALLVAMILLSVVLQMILVERATNGRSVASTLVALGMLLGLLANTKLNGFAAWPLVLATTTITLFGRAPRVSATIHHPLRSVLAVPSLIALPFLVACVTLIATNPSLYRHPVRFVCAMAYQRLETIAGQRLLLPEATFPTIGLKASAFLSGIFGEQASWIPLPLFAYFFIIGVIRGFSLARKTPKLWVVFATNAAGWTAITFLTFEFNTTRYLLPAIPFVCYFAGEGMFESCLFLRNLAASWNRRVAIASVGFALSLAGYALVLFINMPTYLHDNPQWLATEHNRAKAILTQLPSSTADEENYPNVELYFRRLVTGEAPRLE